MNIIKRISRLFIADLHGLLDTLEEPEAQLKQAIREMENHLDNAANEMDSMVSGRDQLERQKLYAEQQLEILQNELALCFAEQQDDLAKTVLRKKLQHQKQLLSVQQQLHSLTEKHSKLQAETDEQQEKLQLIKEKLALLSETNQQDTHYQEPGTGTSVSQDDIDVAFLYEKQRFQSQPTALEPDHE